MSKGSLLLGVALGSAALLLVSRGPWLLIKTDDALRAQTLSVSGSDAMPAVSAAALVGLACAGALSIAGPRARSVIFLVSMSAAVLAGWAVSSVLLDPVGVVGGLSLGDATGAGSLPAVGGSEDVQVTVWPGIGLLIACAVAVGSVLGAVSGTGGDAPPGRFARARAHNAAAGAKTEEGPDHGSAPTPAHSPPPSPATDQFDDDAARVWDALSQGEDPTR